VIAGLAISLLTSIFIVDLAPPGVRRAMNAGDPPARLDSSVILGLIGICSGAVRRRSPESPAARRSGST